MDRYIIVLDPGTPNEMCVGRVFYTPDAVDEYADRYLKRRPFVAWELTASGIRRRSLSAESVTL